MAASHAARGGICSLPRPEWSRVKGTAGQEAMPHAVKRGG